jgi:GNAT superfamily N-acetyltransferase
MIRPTTPADTPTLLALAAGTGVFKPHEVQTLREVLDDFHANPLISGHRCVSYELDGQVIGFAYYAPTPMTDRTWTLWWIAVSKQTQTRGVGSKLLQYLEDDIRKENARLLALETSSLPGYEPTRRFYLKHGYTQSALVRDYYAEGDDMVFFSKRMD